MNGEKPDFALLKRGGVMRQVEPGLFSLRLRVVAGRLTSGQMKAIGGIAARYGSGAVHLTARQGVEIPFVPFGAIEDVKKALGEAGLSLGACGPRVRTVTGCQGAEVCPHGLARTESLCAKMDAEFAGMELPHKFKFGVAACPRACLKPVENDIGVQAAVEPEHSPEACSLCGICEQVCTVGAIKVTSGGVLFDSSKCDGCGDCVASCPTDSWKAARNGFVLFAGGKMGRKPVLGKRAGRIITGGEEELLDVLRRAIAFYAREGRPGERFGDTLQRTGLAAFETEVFEWKEETIANRST